MPPWFTEGLAEHFEVWDLRRDAAHNRRICHEATSARLRAVRAGALAPPLTEILSLDSTTWVPDEGGPRTQRNYALAAAFVDFLLAAPERERVFQEVFARLAAGMTPARVLGTKDLAALTPAWQEHWRRRVAAPR
jgi:hypothetical protein